MDRSAVDFVAFVTGILTHVLYFRIGEHHLQAPRYLQVALATAAGGALLVSIVSKASLYEAIWPVLDVEYKFLGGVFISLCLYRIFFHRLRKFPGPFGARLSSFWFTSQVAAHRDAYKVLTRLHEKYGDFLRIGPSDMSISHPDSVQIIYGPGSKCQKAPWYDGSHPHDSMHQTRSRTLHDKRRRIWSPAFSDKALRGYEDRIRMYADKLLTQVGAHCGEPLNMTKWFNLYSYDVMGDLAFSKSFGMLDSGKDHWAIGLLNEGMAIAGFHFPVWFIRILLSIPGLAHGYWKFLNFCSKQVDDRCKMNPEVPDIMSALLAPHKGQKPRGKELMLMEGDSRLIVVAGSDTTAATLTHLFYHLARDPAQVAKLRNELAPLMKNDGTVNNVDIQHAEHLNGCINEALRLNPPVPTAIHRLTPPEGIQIGETFVPGNVDVWAPQYVIGKREDTFPNALTFYPERWYSDPGAVKNKNAVAPFLIGPYGCIGKPLALLEIRTVTARLVMSYDVSLAPGEDGTDLLEKTAEQFTLDMGKLDLIFQKRKE